MGEKDIESVVEAKGRKRRRGRPRKDGGMPKSAARVAAGRVSGVTANSVRWSGYEKKNSKTIRVTEKAKAAFLAECAERGIKDVVLEASRRLAGTA